MFGQAGGMFDFCVFSGVGSRHRNCQGPAAGGPAGPAQPQDSANLCECKGRCCTPGHQSRKKLNLHPCEAATQGSQKYCDECRCRIAGCLRPRSDHVFFCSRHVTSFKEVLEPTQSQVAARLPLPIQSQVRASSEPTQSQFRSRFQSQLRAKF